MVTAVTDRLLSICQRASHHLTTPFLTATTTAPATVGSGLAGMAGHALRRHPPRARFALTKLRPHQDSVRALTAAADWPCQVGRRF
jgi:hypothetical protein